MEIKRKTKYFKFLIVLWWLAFLFFIILNFRSSGGKILINDVKIVIQNLGILGPIFFILIYQIRIFLFFPISLLSTLAGAVWGLTGLIYVLIALAICATSEFFMARYLFREKVKIILRGKMNILDEKIGKNALLSVFLIRLVPNVMFDIQNCALAMTKIKYKDYIAGTMLGIFFGTFVLVYFGDSLTNILLRIK